MKTYNNFNEMFNSQSGLKSDVAVFNRVEVVNRVSVPAWVLKFFNGGGYEGLTVEEIEAVDAWIEDFCSQNGCSMGDIVAIDPTETAENIECDIAFEIDDESDECADGECVGGECVGAGCVDSNIFPFADSEVSITKPEWNARRRIANKCETGCCGKSCRKDADDCDPFC